MLYRNFKEKKDSKKKERKRKKRKENTTKKREHHVVSNLINFKENIKTKVKTLIFSLWSKIT